jgi:hypothetical protein
MNYMFHLNTINTILTIVFLVILIAYFCFFNYIFGSSQQIKNFSTDFSEDDDHNEQSSIHHKLPNGFV